MASLRKAIDDMCRHCIYDGNGAGNWKQQVTVCTSFDCPLYPVRPKSTQPIPNAILAYQGLQKADFPADCGFTVSYPTDRGSETG